MDSLINKCFYCGLQSTVSNDPWPSGWSPDHMLAIGHLQCQLVICILCVQAVPKVFCAGLDIREMYKAERGRLAEFWRVFQTFWMKLYTSRLATVAAINVHIFCSISFQIFMKLMKVVLLLGNYIEYNVPMVTVCQCQALVVRWIARWAMNGGSDVRRPWFTDRLVDLAFEFSTKSLLETSERSLTIIACVLQ